MGYNKNTKKKYSSLFNKNHNTSCKKFKGGNINKQEELFNKQIKKLENILNSLCNFEVIIYNKGTIQNLFYDEYGLTPKQCRTYKSIIKDLFPKKSELEKEKDKPISSETTQYDTYDMRSILDKTGITQPTIGGPTTVGGPTKVTGPSTIGGPTTVATPTTVGGPSVARPTVGGPMVGPTMQPPIEPTQNMKEQIINTIPKLEKIQQQLPPKKEVEKELVPKYNVLVKIIKLILDRLLSLSSKK